MVEFSSVVGCATLDGLQREHTTELRSSFFLNGMQHWLVVSYHCFGTTYWCHLQGSSGPIPWPFKMGLIGCPKMLVTNCQSVSHNFPEEWRAHLCNSRCMKSCTQQNYLFGILHIYSVLWSIEVKEGKDVAQKSHSLSLHHQILLFTIMCLSTFLPKTMVQSHFDIS